MNQMPGEATGRSFPRQSSFQSGRWASGTPATGGGYGSSTAFTEPMQVADYSLGQA